MHFVHERVSQKQLSVQFVSSQEQAIDILTKGLSAPLFRTHFYNLRLSSSQAWSWGEMLEYSAQNDDKWNID